MEVANYYFLSNGYIILTVKGFRVSFDEVATDTLKSRKEKSEIQNTDLCV